jgi:hypothetical protein
MDKRFINQSLRKEVKDILENGWEPKKGVVGGNSIEILETKTGSEGQSYSSYIYYEDNKARDKDFTILTDLIENN